MTNTQPEQISELDDTQRAILEGAIQCIYKRGFQNLTTKCIAQEAGVNEVTIFRRFGSKAAVLDALFKYEAHSIATAAIHYTGDLQTDLTRIVDTMWQAIKNRQSIIPIILLELPRNPELRERAQHSIKVVHQLTQIIQQYQNEGQLKPISPQMAFSVLIGPLIFTALITSVMPQTDAPFDVPQYVHQYLTGYGTNQ